jgi:hypothetical protein
MLALLTLCLVLTGDKRDTSSPTQTCTTDDNFSVDYEYSSTTDDVSIPPSPVRQTTSKHAGKPAAHSGKKGATVPSAPVQLPVSAGYTSSTAIEFIVDVYGKVTRFNLNIN